MITVDQYLEAVYHAQKQKGPVVADIICRLCNQRVGNVSRRPRGLYLESKLEDITTLGIEMILRAHDRGQRYDYLTSDGWTEDQVEQIIQVMTSMPDYKLHLERVRPGHRLNHFLIDLFPADSTEEHHRATVMCRLHGNIQIDTRPLRQAIATSMRGKIRFVVPYQDESSVSTRAS
jgi:hypothetical protein